MNKGIFLSIGPPLVMRNTKLKLATIELNSQNCIVCRYHPNNLVYKADAELEKWYPVNLFARLIYQFNKFLYQYKTGGVSL